MIDFVGKPQSSRFTDLNGAEQNKLYNLQNDAESQSDSAYAEPAGSLTASLTSSIMNHTYENGRRYHVYDAGEYIFPNDEKEQDRLDLMHHIFKLILNGKLHFAPITNVQRVLDFGTGTGIWAIDFADEFPAADVIGTDLSPIQPTWLPPNCHFIVDNVESSWTYSSTESFDYIHGRAMSGSIKDWPKLYSEAYKHLKPGGWIEMQDFEASLQSDDGTLKNAKYLSEWQEKINEASSKFEKKMDVAGTYKQCLIDAGFVDVRDEIYKVCSSFVVTRKGLSMSYFDVRS
jgi:SAM-dependent methyltransferase